jgi:hypothetical protein
MKSKLARLRLAALFAVACTFSTAFAAAQQKTLTVTWTPPTQNADGSPLTDLLGYYVYMGLTPETLQPVFFTLAQRIVLHYFPSYVRDGVRYLAEDGVRYFAVSAINADGVESDLTEVLSGDLQVPE